MMPPCLPQITGAAGLTQSPIVSGKKGDL